jgi:hypothetical protein
MKSRTKPNEIPVFLQKRSVMENEYLLGRLNKYEKSPAEGDQLQYYEDDDKNPNYMIKVGRNIFSAPIQDHSDKKKLLLIERRDDRIYISRIARELIFNRKAVEDSEEVMKKTLLLMKNRKVTDGKKEKKGDNGDLTESEGGLTRLAQGPGQ